MQVVVPGTVYIPVILGPGLFVVHWGQCRGVVSLGPHPVGGWGEGLSW